MSGTGFHLKPVLETNTYEAVKATDIVQVKYI